MIAIFETLIKNKDHRYIDVKKGMNNFLKFVFDDNLHFNLIIGITKYKIVNLT